MKWILQNTSNLVLCVASQKAQITGYIIFRTVKIIYAIHFVSLQNCRKTLGTCVLHCDIPCWNEIPKYRRHDWQKNVLKETVSATRVTSRSGVFLWQNASECHSRSSFSEEQKARTVFREPFLPGIGKTNITPLQPNFGPLFVFWNLFQKKNSVGHGWTWCNIEL
jgi:hypothetical protein